MRIEIQLHRFAQKMLLIAACATFAALGYSLWHRWGGLTGMTEWKEALLYYVLPLGAIALGLAFAALWPGIDRLFVLIIAASVIVALVAADLYLGYTVLVDDGAKSAAQRLKFPFDARSKAEVVADLRARGLRAVPFARIVSDPHLITLGVMPNAVVVTCNEFGPWFTPKTDRYGFVNPDAIWDTREPIDVVVVGDSYAMGQCDPTTGGVAELLRKQGLRVLNLGIGGNDSLLDLASLAEFGSMFKSRFIFWLHYAGNDLAGLETNRRLPILQHYLDTPSFRQNLKDRMPEVESRLSAVEQGAYAKQLDFLPYMLSKKGLPRALRLYTLRNSFGLARNINENNVFPLFARVIKRARDISGEMGGKLVVVNIPAAGQVKKDNGVLEDETADVVKKAGVEFVDLKPAFRKVAGDQSVYSQGFKGHFSPTGNKLVAQILTGAINDDAKK